MVWLRYIDNTKIEEKKYNKNALFFAETGLNVLCTGGASYTLKIQSKFVGLLNMRICGIIMCYDLQMRYVETQE